MESTGVYWKPVWHVLEGRFELTLANAMHIRNIPGRKSDVKDAEWIADLLAHGLLRNSFVPPEKTQELRDLTRTRKQMVREVSRHAQRIQKTLEDANIKLTEVISDIMGSSGRAILRALVAGVTDPERLVDLTQGRLKAPRPKLVDALHGRVTEHHRFMIKLHLDQIQNLELAIRDLEARADQGPFRAATQLLTSMPGVSQTAARVIVAEIGDDMSKFPTAGNLRSWALFALASTKVPGDVFPIELASALPGSRRFSSNAPGQPPTSATPTSERSSYASEPVAGRRKLPWPWPPQSSPPPTTC
jgi:transposase